jgi:5-methylcytosine-specific restriction endonuclease McrA
MTRHLSDTHFVSMRKAATLQLVFERDGKRCQHCGIPVRRLHRKCAPFPADMATVDHVIPKSQDGTDDPSNLILSCKRCNDARRDIPLEAFRRRLANNGGRL